MQSILRPVLLPDSGRASHAGAESACSDGSKGGSNRQFNLRRKGVIGSETLPFLAENLDADTDLAVDLLNPHDFALAAQFDLAFRGVHVQPEVNMRAHFVLNALDDEHAGGADVAGDAPYAVDVDGQSRIDSGSTCLLVCTMSVNSCHFGLPEL